MRARTQRGGANYVFYSADMQARMEGKHEHQADLYRALGKKNGLCCITMPFVTLVPAK